ncbi:thymidine phosphorylase [Pseudodesulfovibrio sp. zrk46]|uniref:thymidine phosphorylase n=1 Tax=Pseudodesulfovibrio sp. zrk46 TaxID=2725288 RepID=UPI0014492916|nr:thymidine phosphorylase [Pseudodesulfovibrio sp. zrk46]QJB57902.1 thymidine phosphorylase [Pseudodesulfovibrio sp. zrk46]
MTLLPQEIIRRKRDGHVLSSDEIQYFIHGLVKGTVTEGQVAALGMAVYFQGMVSEECAALTRAMTESGNVLQWDLDGPVLDKHSTGGVGDLVSLALGPIIAACGGYVPMISGRGLGHTGGTLDKLESIPGYNTVPDNALFRRAVKEAGVAIIGQTGNLAPADGRFYAIRDVTATVESIPLITASILSKKLAAGLDALVMDVKTGSGAFMSEYDDAVSLAESIVSVAEKAQLSTSALVTNMDEPLAPCAGNALEVAETVRYLTGAKRDDRLDGVIMGLCAEMLVLGGIAKDEEEGINLARRALESGAAAERFEHMVFCLGGPSDFMEKSESYLPVAPIKVSVDAQQGGYVSSWDTRQLGLAVVSLGGGRTSVEQSVDHSVGVTEIVRVGESVEVGQPLAVLHCTNETNYDSIVEMVRKSVVISNNPPKPRNIIYRYVRP